MKIGYADPPYPGCAHRYKDHPDYDGEVDHAELVNTLLTKFDGFVLHTSAPELDYIYSLFPRRLKDLGCRTMAWVKPFAAFKRNVSVAYAWEPVIIKPCRKPVVRQRIVMCDWVSESITLKKGLCGAKPAKVCAWAFEMLGMEPQDEFVDLFPGTWAVTEAHKAWKEMVVSEAKPEPAALDKENR